MADPVWPVPQPCEDCGGSVVAGPEAGLDDVSEWCTNPACPSNHVITGLVRTGVGDYRCTDCAAALRTPFDAVLAHRRAHRTGLA